MSQIWKRNIEENKCTGDPEARWLPAEINQEEQISSLNINRMKQSSFFLKKKKFNSYKAAESRDAMRRRARPKQQTGNHSGEHSGVFRGCLKGGRNQTGAMTRRVCITDSCKT